MQAPIALAEIGEVEAAVTVKYEVIGPVELQAVAGFIKALDLAGFQVDTLDPPSRLVMGPIARNEQATILVPLEPAIIGDIDRAIRTQCGTVGTATELRDDFRLSVPDTCQCLSCDLHQHDTAISHGDRPFGKSQTGCEFTNAHEACPFDRE
jgi:hypothetical protein